MYYTHGACQNRFQRSQSLPTSNVIGHRIHRGVKEICADHTNKHIAEIVTVCIGQQGGIDSVKNSGDKEKYQYVDEDKGKIEYEVKLVAPCGA